MQDNRSFEQLCIDTVQKELSSTGEVRPHINLILNDGRVMYFDYNGDDETLSKARKIITQTIRLARISNRFLFASFMSEAWVSRRTIEDPMPNLRASEDPGKKEGVFCFVYTQAGRVIHMWDIKRTAEGKPELVKLKPGFDEFETWLDDAFAFFPAPAPLDVQREANELLDRMYPRGTE